MRKDEGSREGEFGVGIAGQGENMSLSNYELEEVHGYTNKVE